MVRKLEREAPGPVRVFYEAGPCGYALQRQVTTSRVSCDVVAPALIPRKPGERVKTNRRDARKLAEMGRAGLLTAVQPPTPDDEAVPDLPQARDDARRDGYGAALNCMICFLIRSFFKLPKKDSATALSQQLPLRLMLGSR